MRSRTYEVAVRNDLPIPGNQRTIIRTTARTTAPIKPVGKITRRAGVFRMISPPRAFFGGIWFLIHETPPAG
jgi:hypothetical protein